MKYKTVAILIALVLVAGCVDTSELEAKIDSLEKEKETLTKSKDDLTKEVATLRTDKDTLKADLDDYKAKYDDAVWPTVAKPLNNALRERCRTALVGHSALGLAQPQKRRAGHG